MVLQNLNTLTAHCVLKRLNIKVIPNKLSECFVRIDHFDVLGDVLGQ